MKKLLLLIFLVTVSCTRQVTFMSYNIRNCNGLDNRCDISRIARTITDTAEFIALQEVDSMTGRSGNTYLLGELAKMTGMHATFCPAIDYDGGKYGIGLLSKAEPLGYRTYPLPGSEEERVLLVVEFEKIYVCTAHFSLTEKDRITSANIVTGIIGNLDKPAIFAGDLNALPESEEIAILKGALTPVICGEKTWQADTPTEAIDYIFCTEIQPVESKVIEEKVASDHRPVWARFQMK